MNTEIRKALDEEILDEINRLSGLEVGSEEYKVGADGIAKLMDRAIEIDKLDAEREEKSKSRNQDFEMKNKQLMEQIKARETDAEIRNKQIAEQIEARRVDTEIRTKQLMEQAQSRFEDTTHKNALLAEERKGRLISNILTFGMGAVNILVLIWGTKTSLKFEETGTITTHAGRNFISKLFRK